MAVCAAVMTGSGVGAIATIQLVGDAAEAVLRKVFQRKDGRPFELAAGRVLLGHIVDRSGTIDEVTLGGEGPDIYAIHCHGNPLIVTQILEVLRRHGVEAAPSEQLLARVWSGRKSDDAISIEARLALTVVKTVEGASIIGNQVRAGLSEKIRQWHSQLDSMPLDRIAAEAQEILEHSKPARLVISGCTIALVGPPNTGKSTLLNALAGRDKAIVSDIRGTTRDWVSAEIHIPPLAATLIDTAGLDPVSATSDVVDETAQQASIQMIERAEVILLVVDSSRPAGQLSESVLKPLLGREVLTVLNKADLPARFDPRFLPKRWKWPIGVSAKQGSGLGDLIGAIHRVCGVAGFEPQVPVAFTERQIHLLKMLQDSDSKARARSILSELRGQLSFGIGRP